MISNGGAKNLFNISKITYFLGKFDSLNELVTDGTS